MHLLRRPVDGGEGRGSGGNRVLEAKAGRIGSKGSIERGLTDGMNRVNAIEVEIGRGEQGQAGVMMLEVVPVKKGRGPIVGVGTGVKEIGIGWGIFESFELSFRERIVIGDAGSGMAFGDMQIGKELGGGFGLHGGTPIGMNGELVRGNVMVRTGDGDKVLGLFSRLLVGNHPADHKAAEDVEDDVEIQIDPLGDEQQAGDIPRPDAIGSLCAQLWLDIDRPAGLSTPLTHKTVLSGEAAIHGAPVAQIRAFRQQAAIDLTRRGIHKSVAVKNG